MAIPNNRYLELIHYKDFFGVITHVREEESYFSYSNFVVPM